MKHTEYLKKKKRRESRKRIISILAAFVVFVATYALVLPALTLDVNTARMEPGMSVQQSADPEAVSAPESSEVEEAEPEEEKSVEAEEPADEEKPEKEEASSVEEESAKDEEAAKEEQVSEEQADSAAAQKEEPSSKEDQDDAAAANTDAAAESVDQTGSDAADENAEAAVVDETDAFKAPELEAIDFDGVLTDKTGFYYYHADKDEDAAAVSSTDIDDWKKVKDDTVLAPEDFVRVYLAYTIPAGALNETNTVARYRLPDGLELTDKQIKAINKNENGISGKDKDAADYKKYLGAEAIEGTRTPDKDRSDEEYISATVKAEKVYKDDKYIGQDLVFTFAPYTVQKNQIGYDEKGTVKSEGKAVKGWFSFDLTPSRIGFEEIKKESAEDEADAEDDIDLIRSQAKITFVKENKKKDIEEISCELILEAPAGAAADEDQEEEKADQAEQKTLTYEGADYTVVINYTDEAQIPDNAELAVSEIEKGTDEYNDYLKQAENAVDEDKTVNEARFFDITILADGDKVEPAAPVSVQINFTGIEQTKAEDTQLLHYTEDEVQVMDKAEFGKSEESENDAKAVDTVQFETDGFSVYAIVGTETITTQVITAEGETFEISVTYGTDAKIPRGSRLVAKEYSKDSEEYQKALESVESKEKEIEENSVLNQEESEGQTAEDESENQSEEPASEEDLAEEEKDNNTIAFHVFDISILNENEEEIEPAAPVDVKITLKKIDESVDTEEIGKSILIDVQHLKETDEGITPELVADLHRGVDVDAEKEQMIADFSVDSFSRFTVRYLRNNTTQASVYVHYVDQYGNEFQGTQTDRVDLTTGTLDLYNYATDTITAGGNTYKFKEARYQSYQGDSVRYLRVNNNNLYLQNNEQRSYAANNTYSVDVTSNTDRHVYLVYLQDGVDTTIHPGGSSVQPGGDEEDIGIPDHTKTLTENLVDGEGDGTYDLSLDVTGRASSESKNTKADILIIYDISGSMMNYYVGNTGRRRGQVAEAALNSMLTELYKNNANDVAGEDPTVRVALQTFSYVSRTDKRFGFKNTKSEFDTAFHNIVNANSNNHGYGGGTNWEDGLQDALTFYNANKSADRDFYVLFVSDGNPTCRVTEGDYYLNWENEGGAGNAHRHTNNNQPYISTGTNVDTPERHVDRSYQHARDDARALVEAGAIFYSIGIFADNMYRIHNLANYAYTTFDEDGKIVTDYSAVAASAGDLDEIFAGIIKRISSSLGFEEVEITDGLTGMSATALINGTAGNFTYTAARYNTTTSTVSSLPEGVTVGASTKDSNGTITTYTANSGGGYTRTVRTLIPRSTITGVKSGNNVSFRFPDGTTDTVAQATYNETTKRMVWDMGSYQLRNGYTYTVTFTVWPNQASYDLIAALKNGLLNWGDDYTYTDEDGVSQTIPYSNADGTGYGDQIDQTTLTLKTNVDSGNEVSYFKVSTQTQNSEPEGLTPEQINTLNTTGTLTITEYDQQDPQKIVKITIYTKNNDGTYTKTEKTPGTANYVNPDPVPLAGSQFSLTKNWKDDLDPSHLRKLIEDAGFDEEGNPKYSITLNVLVNGKDYKSYKFYPVKNSSGGYEWPSQEVFIAPALLVSELPEGADASAYKTVTLAGTQYYVLNDGHQYTITEGTNDFHFVFSADPYHPALVDSATELSNVEFDVDENGSIKDGSTATIIGEVPIETFDAYNHLTSELDITKKINDPKDVLTSDQENAETFTYKVTLTVPKDTDANTLYAYEFVPRSDPWDGSRRIYAYGYQNNEDDSVKGLADDVTRFNQQVFGRYTVSYPGGSSTLEDLFTDDGNDATKTGTIFITLKQNEIIRFANLPLGTKYKIQEIYANLRQSDPSRDADALPSANTEASNIEEQGYSVSIRTKNGSPTVSSTATDNDTVSGEITELDTRYYNQFTNELDDAATINLAVTKHLQGYKWNGERYYMKLSAETGNTTLNRFTVAQTQRYLTRDTGTEDVSYTFTTPVRFAEPGTYTYYFKEMTGAGPTADDEYREPVLSGTYANGIYYGEISTVKVKVEKINGKLTVTGIDGSSSGVTINDEKNLVTAKITNRKGVLIKLLKLGDGDFEKPLKDVKFKLYNNADCADEHQVIKDISDVVIGDNGLITTSEDGMADIGLLASGTYYLKETEGAAGYNLPAEPISIVVRDDGTITYTQISYTDSGKGPDLVYEDADRKLYYYSKIRGDESDVYKDDDTYTFIGYRIVISNASGVELPMTGGPGTFLYTLGGIALIMASALMYGFRMRRRERRFK